MCKCTPEVRTPYCGKGDCLWPESINPRTQLGIDDSVNHPKHYNSGKALCKCGRPIECIDITRHNNFNVGNAIKYLWRTEHKGGIEDLRKAIWYINDEIERLSDV